MVKSGSFTCGGGVAMRSRMTTLILFVALIVLSVGCATSEEWQDWRGHTTHFASGQHGTFSLRNNKDGSNPRVGRTDLEAARIERWWRTVITVSPEQIFESR
jgi:hypothetical protein